MTQPAGEFGGEERFAAAPERLFAVVTDLETLSENIPNLVSAERSDEHTLKCVVKPGFSFLRGTLKLTISLADLEPPTAAAMTIAAQGIGSAMQIVSRLQIAPDGAGSLLQWQAKIERASQAVCCGPPPIRRSATPGSKFATSSMRRRLNSGR